MQFRVRHNTNWLYLAYSVKPELWTHAESIHMHVLVHLCFVIWETQVWGCRCFPNDQVCFDTALSSLRLSLNLEFQQLVDKTMGCTDIDWLHYSVAGTNLYTISLTICPIFLFQKQNIQTRGRTIFERSMLLNKGNWFAHAQAAIINMDICCSGEDLPQPSLCGCNRRVLPPHGPCQQMLYPSQGVAQVAHLRQASIALAPWFWESSGFDTMDKFVAWQCSDAPVSALERTRHSCWALAWIHAARWR